MQIQNLKLKTQNKFRNLKPETRNLKASAGFTLLFASLIGSLVFTIGIAILNISLKQLALTSAGRESQQSFYAADSGIECALLLDRGAGDPDCSAGFFGVASSTAVSEIAVCDVDSQAYTNAGPSAYSSCYGEPIAITVGTQPNVTGIVSSFEMPNHITDICFKTTVIKRQNTVDSQKTDTIIESRGYSTCNSSVNRYERAIRTYNY